MADKTKKSPRPGDRLVHNEIDSKEGMAKTGVVVDVYGDDDQKIVVGQWDDEEGNVAFDSRELKSLGSPKQSSGPVITKFRHLKPFFRKRELFAAIFFALFAGVLLAFVADEFDFGTTETLLGAAVIIAIGLVGFNRMESVRPDSDKSSS